ncbi:MAG: energy-coupling factor ABC transporter permease [Egibacteraceae bacterium]
MGRDNLWITFNARVRCVTESKDGLTFGCHVQRPEILLQQLLSSRKVRDQPICGGAVHIPDGWIKAGTAAASGAVSLSAVSASLIAAKSRLQERQVPLIGLVAAFLLVIQAIHIPFGPGVSAHLLGGALAAVLLGPWLGFLVVAAVVLVETSGLGHGGVATLGANVALTGLIACLGGYWLFRGLLILAPRTRRGFLTATAVTSWLTVVLAAAVGSAMITYGGVLGAGQARPFIGVMVVAHGLVGIAEAVITTAAVGAVMTARPDLMATRELLPATRAAASTR